jgi:hypothetical protein
VVPSKWEKATLIQNDSFLIEEMKHVPAFFFLAAFYTHPSIYELKSLDENRSYSEKHLNQKLNYY